MTEAKSDSSWPGADEHAVVMEMEHNRSSHHWEECYQFVKRRVYTKAKNVPNSFQEEVIQEVMFKVAKSLPGFQFRCALTTWLNTIIEHCIIDIRRKLQKQGQLHAPLGDPLNEDDHDGEGLPTKQTQSAEDAFMIDEELRRALATLLDYASTHSNPTRDRLIIRMVILEGHTHANTAIAAGCHAPVVGYVVREAQRYARDHMK